MRSPSSRCVIVLALLLAGACGKKGAPEPPLRPIPQAAQDLTVRQRGDELLFELAFPPGTTSGLPLPPLAAVDLWVFSIPTPESGMPLSLDPREFEKIAQLAVTLEGAELDSAIAGDRISFRVPGERQDPPRSSLYGVRTRVESGEESDFSNLVPISLEEPPPGPDAVAVTAAANGIQLSWEVDETAFPPAFPPEATGDESDDSEEPAGAEGAEPPLEGVEPPEAEEATRLDTEMADLVATEVAPAGEAPGPTTEEAEPISTTTAEGGETAEGGADAGSDKAEAVVEETAEGGADAESGEAEAVVEETAAPVPTEPAPGSLAGFHVYRRSAQERSYGPPVAELDAAARSHLDRSALFGERYIYTVTAVVAGPQTLESSVTIEKEIHYEDRFPPPAPTDAVAFPESGRVRLVWKASVGIDIAGYTVYRQDPELDFRRLQEELLTRLEYRDQGLVPGLTYRYRVTATDQSGNEGTPGKEVEVTIP